jgi:hypothetical protein
VPVTEPYAGERLDLHVAHRVPLHLREPTHLALDELDVLDHLVREGVDERPHLVRVEPEAVGRPGVELAGVLTHRRVAAGPHVRDDLGDPVRNIALRPVRERGGGCALEVLGHRLSWESGTVCHDVDIRMRRMTGVGVGKVRDRPEPGARRAPSL